MKFNASYTTAEEAVTWTLFAVLVAATAIRITFGPQFDWLVWVFAAATWGSAFVSLRANRRRKRAAASDQLREAASPLESNTTITGA